MLNSNTVNFHSINRMEIYDYQIFWNIHTLFFCQINLKCNVRVRWRGQAVHPDRAAGGRAERIYIYFIFTIVDVPILFNDRLVTEP